MLFFSSRWFICPLLQIDLSKSSALMGDVTSAPPCKDEKNFMYQKNDDCHNHRLCVLYVELTCAFSHRFLSFRWFVGLLTYPFMCGEFFSHKRIVSAFSLSHDSSSNDRFSSHARFALHGNNPLEIQLLFKSYLSLALAEKADSFRVRDSHPIPLFSEQECVSDCSGRAFATKAIVCNFRQK